MNIADHIRNMPRRRQFVLIFSTVVLVVAGAVFLSLRNVGPSPVPTATSNKHTRIISSSPCGIHTGPPPATYQHVLWIWMENKTYDQVIDNQAAPVQTDLANKCASDPDYVEIGTLFPPGTQSLGNYMAATSGLKEPQFGGNCSPGNACQSTAENLFRQMRSAGISYKNYQEGMSDNCSLTDGDRK